MFFLTAVEDREAAERGVRLQQRLRCAQQRQQLRLAGGLPRRRLPVINSRE